VRVVDDDRGDAAARQQPVEFHRVWQEAGCLGRQLDHLLAGPLDEPVVFQLGRGTTTPSRRREHLEHDRESCARAWREQHFVWLEAHLGVG